MKKVRKLIKIKKTYKRKWLIRVRREVDWFVGAVCLGLK